MIDYIKARFKDKAEIEGILRKSDKFSLIGKYDLKGNVISYPITTEIDNFNLRITDKWATIENSLHKNFNEQTGSGFQNADDFYHYDIKYALMMLESYLGYNLSNTILNNLEFGFNIDIGINPTIFLKKHVLMYKHKSPCYDPKNRKNMKIKKFTYNEYEIKMYDKSLHLGKYTKSDTILRVEIKYKTKKQFNKFGIYNLNDLKKPECIELLFEDYLNKLKELIIIDNYDGCIDMKRKERQVFSLFTNPNFWVDTRLNHHANTYQNRKNEFQRLIKKYNQDKWHKTLIDLLEKKFFYLSNDSLRIFS